METPNEPIVFRELTGPDDPALPAYLALYERAFPPEERVPVADFETVLSERQEGRSPHMHQVAALEENVLVGMAQFAVKSEGRVGYAIYLAVDEKRRGSGIGSLFFREIADRMRAEQPPLRAMLFEVEDPDHCASEGRRFAERRIEFYRRHGARMLTGIHYLQVVPDYPEGVPMKIMVLLFEDVIAEEAFAMAESLFGGNVSRAAGSLGLE